MSLARAEELCALLRGDAWRMAALEAVRDLRLPDCWIGAGFIRSFVWDRLSGFETSIPEDVDVVYYDPRHTSEDSEKAHDAMLAARRPGVPWSCKNQARMHLKAGLAAPYADAADGLRHWTETATAVAARMDDSGRLHILAPFGLEDLFTMTVRPTPFFRAGRMAQYRARLHAKGWQRRWTGLKFVDGEAAAD